MRETGVDRIVEEYLAALRAALRGVSRPRRVLLLEEITEHIRVARAALAHETEAAVRDLLEHLGTPEDIAAEAGVGLSGGYRFAWLSRSRVLMTLGAAAVVGLAIALPLGLAQDNRPPHPGSSSISTTTSTFARTAVVVPSVLGLNQASAVAMLNQLGLNASVSFALSSGPRGVIVSQQPAVGHRVVSGSLVKLWVTP